MLADDLDGAETVLDEATELLETLTGSSGAGAAVAAPRRHPGAPRRLRGRPRARAARGRDADLRRDESVLVRAILARIAWLAGDLDAHARDRRRRRAPRLERPRAGAPGAGPRTAFVHGAARRSLALEDGDLEGAATRLAQAHRDRRWRRPTCRSSPWWGSIVGGAVAAAPGASRTPPSSSAPPPSCAGRRTVPTPSWRQLLRCGSRGHRGGLRARPRR